MAEQKKLENNKVPTVENVGHEPSERNVAEEAETVSTRIDRDAEAFRAEEGVENPSVVIEVDGLAKKSKDEIKLVLNGEEKPINQERVVFDYSGANDWLELSAQIGKNMSSADADLVLEAVKAFREGQISEKQLPVTPDSHIKEVALKLKKRDALLNEKPSEKVVMENKEEGVAGSTENKDEIKNESPAILETKFDIKDAVTKGKINKLKIFLDKLNKAGNYSDDPEKKILLNEAALLLDNPNLVAESPDLGLAIEKAHITIENKIKGLESDIRVAQLERLIEPLKKLISAINSADDWGPKTEALKTAAQLLGKPELASAVLQHSKEEQELLISEALKQATLLAEARIRQIEEEINKAKNTSKETPENITEKPELNPEPIPEKSEAEPVKPEPVIPEKVEKDLGYLDIDPKVIWEKMTPKDMEALQALMKAGDMVKVNEFYQTKIKEVLVDQHKEGSVNEDLEKQLAEAVNAIIQQTIESEAQRQLLESGGFAGHMLGAEKGKRRYAVAKIARSFIIIGGVSVGISLLGVGTGGAAVVATAGAMTLARFAMRKWDENRAASRPASIIEREKEKYNKKLDKKKAEVLETIFSADNLEQLRKQLSGNISNVLRVQTSERALKVLREYDQADCVKEPEIAGAKLREVEKELYLNALTKVRAENPEATPEQQQNMALTLALTLGQHEKGENYAKQRLEEIKKSKPRLYALIEKFNLLNAGSPDKKPAGMSKEEEDTWDKHKYDMVSLGIGTAIGIGIRKVGPVRIAMGAAAGAGIGYKVGEWMEKRDEKKAFAEIVKMIDESEEVVRDIEFPTEEIDKLKKDSVFVKSKLDLGLLDGDPLLKSRAENFIHQVQKIELANQEAFKKLLESVSDRTDKRAEQVEEDLNRIGSKLKNRRLLATIGGAIIGGAVAWWYDEHTHKKDVEQKPSSDTKAESSKPGGYGVEQPRPPQVTGNPYFEDKIDSTNLNGSDSIWRSTHQMFEDHAKELGYKGDINDHRALSAWAENQTGNAVQHLNQEQGGNINDLVHNADKVRLSFENGKPHLSFINSSGIEAGHLSDTNVGHLVEGQHFNANTEHHFGIDPRTGDQYLEVKSPDGLYRVYDWDRDGQPNVQFPDGHNQEMSSADLSKFLADKNIVTSPEVLAAQAAATEAAAKAATELAATQAAAVAAQQHVETFLTQGGAYNHELFEAAKNSGHLDDVVDKVVNSANQTQAGGLVYDFARDQGWSAEKTNVFLGALRSGEKIDLSAAGANVNGAQVISESMKAFERAALDSFDKVKDMPADHWMVAKLGDDYALVQKVHSGVWPFRGDHFLVDTNGDHQIDATLDNTAMRQTFIPGQHISPQAAEVLGQATAHPTETSTAEAGILNRADASFVELTKNAGAMDTFINHDISIAERIHALTGFLPGGKISDFNGIALSQHDGKLLWHLGNQSPLEVTDKNIDGLAEIMKVVRDKAGTSLPSNWDQQVSRAYEQAVNTK